MFIFYFLWSTKLSIFKPWICDEDSFGQSVCANDATLDHQRTLSLFGAAMDALRRDPPVGDHGDSLRQIDCDESAAIGHDPARRRFDVVNDPNVGALYSIDQDGAGFAESDGRSDGKMGDGFDGMDIA